MILNTNLPFAIELTFWGHIVGGIVALAIFTLPLFSRKGGRVHIRTGWIYSAAMLLVFFSTFIISPWRYFLDPHRTDKSQAFALFLFFIALFSLSALQQGILVLKYKERAAPVFRVQTLGLPILLFLVSVLISGFGFASQNWLFVSFGVLAGTSAGKQLTYWKNAPKHSKDWWFFHLENMFTCCIATVTAFVVTAIPRIFHTEVRDSIGVWFAPTFVLVPWMIWFIRKYKKQFGIRK